MATISVERPESFEEKDLADLCDAAETAILDGGGFGWVKTPPRDVLERFWRGVLLVPERDLFVGRLDGVIAGSAQLLRPPKNNEARSFSATISANFVAPWARGHGLARLLTQTVEESARDQGYYFLDLDVRASQDAAIQLYESRGYECWGTNPHYAMVSGEIVSGHYYSKELRAPPRRKKRASKKAAP